MRIFVGFIIAFALVSGCYQVACWIGTGAGSVIIQAGGFDAD